MILLPIPLKKLLWGALVIYIYDWSGLLQTVVKQAQPGTADNNFRVNVSLLLLLKQHEGTFIINQRNQN